MFCLQRAWGVIALERSWGTCLAAAITNSSVATAALAARAVPAGPELWRGLLGTGIWWGPAACPAFWNYPEVQVSRAGGEGCHLQSKVVMPLGGFAARCWGSRRAKWGTPCLSGAQPLSSLKGHIWVEIQMSPQQMWGQEVPPTAARCLLLGTEHLCVPSSLWHRVAGCGSPGAAPLPEGFLAHLGMACCLRINNLTDYKGTLADTVVPVKSNCL